MNIFNSAPKIVSKEEEEFVTELQNDLNSFYDLLKQKCAGKTEGEQYFKKAKLALDKKLKENYTPQIRDIVENKHCEPSDTEFKQSLLKQIKDDLRIHIDTEEDGVQYID